MGEINLKDVIEKVSKQIDSMMHNRLVLSILMISDGVWFIIDPKYQMDFTSRIIAFFAIVASVTIIITNIKSKKKDTKSLIIATIMTIASIYFLIFPRLLSLNLRILIAIFIISNGLINIFNVTKLNRISSQIVGTENAIKEKLDNDETDDKEGILVEQTEKVVNPLRRFIDKTKGKSILYFILNIISIILGIILLTANRVTYVIIGLILIYTGLSDLLMYLKTRKVSRKVKARV